MDKVKNINCFCVNTPFQGLVVENIIQQYLFEDTNIVVSTVSTDNCIVTYRISKTFKGALEMNRLFYYLKNNIERVFFYVPHLGSTLASLFNDMSLKYNRPINVYYEGIALYYNPLVKQSLTTRIVRSLLCLAVGKKYKAHEVLYPLDFVKRVDTCYAPKNILLGKYSRVKEFNFKVSYRTDKGNLLVLLSNHLNESLNAKIIECIKENLDKNSTVVYVKPHYELGSEMIDTLVDQIESKVSGVNLSILDKDRPIELFYSSISFSKVISQEFSSALVNMHLILDKCPQILIIDKSFIPKDIAEKFGLEYGG